jgi:hypothetical protein
LASLKPNTIPAQANNPKPITNNQSFPNSEPIDPIMGVILAGVGSIVGAGVGDGAYQSGISIFHHWTEDHVPFTIWASIWFVMASRVLSM